MIHVYIMRPLMSDIRYAVQVAAVSTAGRAYVWSCSIAEESGRVSSSLNLRVSVEASTSETCVGSVLYSRLHEPLLSIKICWLCV